jgi:hypothetical protein
METQEQIKAFIYDKLLQREKVMREANQIVKSVSESADMEVDKINNEIQTAQELLDKITESPGAEQDEAE